MQYAHDERLIHRDVKPENILLGPNDEVWLSDFGIVAVAHSTRSLDTEKPGGTVPYMAPEQLRGKPRPASDQYALGIIVYEWLCGERPFGGTATEIAMQHFLEPPPSLREKMPAVTPDVEQVVLTALAKDPTARFASVQARHRTACSGRCAAAPGPRISQDQQGFYWWSTDFLDGCTGGRGKSAKSNERAAHSSCAATSRCEEPRCTCASSSTR